MKDFFLNNSMILIDKYDKKHSAEELEKMRYGLEGIYLTIFKLITVLVLSLFLGILKEVVLVLFAYNALRFFGFGMHARNSTECLIISVSFFVLFPFLVFKGFILYNNYLLIYLICLLNIVLFAPSDTVKRPLTNRRKRLFRKSASTILTFIYFYKK